MLGHANTEEADTNLKKEQQNKPMQITEDEMKLVQGWLSQMLYILPFKRSQTF